MLLYIIRHADPIYEPDSITELGKLQAQALAKRMAGINPDKIYCSPKIRAQQTAQPTCDLLKKQYVIDDWMYEIGWEYSFIDEEGNREIVMQYKADILRNDEFMGLGKDWYNAGCVRKTKSKEDFDRISKHSDEFLSRHGYERENGRYKIISPNEETIAVFCHGNFGRTWLSHLLEIPPHIMWSGFGMYTTGVTALHFENHESGYTAPRCLYYGDVSHLYAERLPIV